MALATVVVIVAAAVALFFNPVWVGFEQARTGVPAIIGFSSEQVHAATTSILAEFVLGPGTFAVEVDGRAVLNARERGHMADVRSVVIGFAVLTLVALLVLAASARAATPRAWVWRSVAVGAGALAGGMLIAGVFVVLFFEAAFEFFHSLLFPAGSYTFDPTTDRLVQLFPMTFWSETSIALAGVLLVLSLVVVTVALRRLPAAEVDGRVEISSPAAAG